MTGQTLREPGSRRTRALRRRLALAALTIAALAAGLTAASAAQAQRFYGGEYWWGCTYSWGSPCIEPHYETAIHYLRSMDPDNAAAWLEAETENRYKAPRADGIERCVGAAVWNGGQTEPWVGGWGYVVAEYPSGPPGYGFIGSCVPYYGIALYQYVNWGEA
jgi:hypothetical protein